MNNWKIELYNGSQDLDTFFAEAHKKGFYNNNSIDILLNSISNIEETKLWLLYYKNQVVGTNVAHSLKELGILGKNAWRIASRTCVLTHKIDNWKIGVKNYSDLVWNNPTAQFLIPACIDYVGKKNPMYISTHNGDVGKQNAVHRVWTKAQVEAGILKNPLELEYRGSIQTFWQVDVDVFKKIINQHRWC